MAAWHVRTLTCGVPGLDLGLQLQGDAGHLLVGGVAGATPFGLLGRVALEVDEGNQTVAAGLPAACRGQSSLRCRPCTQTHTHTHTRTCTRTHVQGIVHAGVFSDVVDGRLTSGSNKDEDLSMG